MTEYELIIVCTLAQTIGRRIVQHNRSCTVTYAQGRSHSLSANNLASNPGSLLDASSRPLRRSRLLEAAHRPLTLTQVYPCGSPLLQILVEQNTDSELLPFQQDSQMFLFFRVLLLLSDRASAQTRICLRHLETL